MNRFADISAPSQKNPDHSDDLQTMGEVTVLLKRWREGDEAAVNELLPLVYRELRNIAAAYLSRERSDHTLQSTALVHEAYLRLSQVRALDVTDRQHFLTLAARTMRRILVDHARSQIADKRVGAHRKVPLGEALFVPSEGPEQIIAIHGVLDDFKAECPRQGALVELRFFGGLTEAEAAEILEVSQATAKRDWRFARLWLFQRLKAG